MSRLRQWSAVAVLFVIGALVLLAPAMLAGCASILPPAPATPAQSVYDLKAALVAAEDVGLGYAQARCGAVSACTAPGVVPIAEAIIAADAAVNVAEATVKANGADATAIGTAQAAVKALQALVAQYAASSGAAMPASTTSPTGGAS